MNKLTFLKRLKRPSIGQIIFWVIVLILAFGGFFFVRGLVACWTLTSLAGMPLPGCATAGGNPLSGPVISEGTAAPSSEAPLPPPPAAPASQLPPPWDGASRINVLFIGLDYRDWEAGQGAPRSDTMILFTIDPISKTAGMLSIPRDLWVNIPGFGYSRINTAYSSGEANALPGGGPGLAMRTVENFLGVPVHYYAQVDFYTFIELIDMIGGIDVYVEQNLILDPIGPGMDKLKVTCCGMRHLNGEKALAYARTRKTQGGDVDRAKRQQQVIFAIRDKVFSPEYFPTLIAQAPDLYAKVSAGIRTNMSLDDAIKLAVLLNGIPRENIKTGVIDYTMVTLDNVILGGENASIFKPIPDKIRVLRDEIFTTSGPLSPMAQGDPLELAKQESARISVLDGTFSGLDTRTGNYLLAQGLMVTGIGGADRGYNTTVVVMYTDKLYTMRYLLNLFGAQLLIKSDPSSPVDIEVRLGYDWVARMPPGY